MNRIRHPWYKDGLKFSCTGCGDCCRSPGFVKLTGKDIRRFNRANLEIKVDWRRLPQGELIPVIAKEYKDPCPLLEGDECSIYKDRPEQCRTYPFWPRCLEGRGAWVEESHKCEGIGQGLTYTGAEISGILDGTKGTRGGPGSDS